MAVAAFVKGALIEMGNRTFKLARKIDVDNWQLEDQTNGRFEEKKVPELLLKYVGGELIFVNDSEFHIDKKQAELSRKRQEVAVIQRTPEQIKKLKVQQSYVMAVEYLPVSEKLMTAAIRQVWEKLGAVGTPPHWITVSRWKKKYIQSGSDYCALLQRDFKKGNRTARYPRQVEHIVEEAIEQHYLTRERETVEETLNFAIVNVGRVNKTLPEEMQLPLPTAKLMRRLISGIDAFDRHAARYGNLAAIKKYRSVLHMNVTDRPLECVEIDHTLLDLMVVDKKSGMPLGRPWITVCIDRYTRCILGIHIGFEPPSYLTVARCLKHAFLPKLNLRETYPNIDNEWLAYGVMVKLIVDNGLEFHGNSLEAVCLSLGIDLQFTPRKTPWWKGAIERFIGTMNRNVAHGFPGTTFSNIFDKDDYDPVKNAVIDLDTLRLIMHKWIVDVYHQKPHRSLDNISPATKWASSIKPEEITLPDNPARLDAILGSVEHRKLTHKGIEYQYMFYNCPDLTRLKNRLGHELDVEIRVDRGDLGHIHLIAPDNSEIFRVPCLNLDYANGISLWQDELFKRYTRNKVGHSNDVEGWRQSKVDIYEIVQESLNGKKKKKHAREARLINSSNNITDPVKPTQEANFLFENSTKDELAKALAIPTYTSTATPKKFELVVETRNLA